MSAYCGVASISHAKLAPALHVPRRRAPRLLRMMRKIAPRNVKHLYSDTWLSLNVQALLRSVEELDVNAQLLNVSEPPSLSPEESLDMANHFSLMFEPCRKKCRNKSSTASSIESIFPGP